MAIVKNTAINMEVGDAITDWHHRLASLTMDMSLSKLREMVKDRGAWRAAVHGVQRVRHDLAAKHGSADIFLISCFFL